MCCSRTMNSCISIEAAMKTKARPVTRRDALCRMGGGFGMMAFAGMVGESLARAQELPRPHHAAKPMLDQYHGQPLPGGSVATERKTGALMRSPFTFKKYGQSGIEVSELFPMV